jgi:hypothetical protein
LFSYYKQNTTSSQKTYVSSQREIKQGVRKGSILGPPIFLLYINDLPLNVKNVKMVLFADDINILVIDRLRRTTVNIKKGDDTVRVLVSKE